MPKTAKKKISNLVSKIRSKLKRKRKVAPRRTRTPRRRTETFFGMPFNRLMGPNTPGSVKTPSPKTRKSPNSVTPNLVPLSQRSPGVKKSLKTPVQQSASPLSIRFTNSGPGGMGPNLKDIRDCHLINNEQECSSNEKCKWNQEEQKCHLKPIPFNLNN